MTYAIGQNGGRIKPAHHLQASCPGCGSPVIAKCGKVYVDHWAHVSNKECDPWYEPETSWHIGWKDQFEEQCREVVIGEHRADIRATRKIMSVPCVIELQHSPSDVEEIIERERFYDRMIWLLDGEGFSDHFEFGPEKRSHTVRSTGVGLEPEVWSTDLVMAKSSYFRTRKPCCSGWRCFGKESGGQITAPVPSELSKMRSCDVNRTW
jgi:hypothetical protein